jgi:predicted AlkP superfamily phosphohydrolase/phosphomutase
MESDGRSTRRVVVVGLDGASLELLGPWMEEGLLPNLARLMGKGVSGGLESVIPPLTPPAWTTAVTGVPPAEHGVLNFARPRFGRATFDFFNALDRRVPALWDYLAAAGKRSLVLHLPAAHPPFEIDGVLISGIPVTNLKSDCTFPSSLKDDLIANVPGYKLYPNTLQLKGERDAYFHDAVATLRTHVEESLYLMDREAWDLLFTVWQPGDSLMHFFWKDMDGRSGVAEREHYIRDYYREADAGIGRIVEAAGDEAHVIVMSDHGHTGVHGAVYLNKWLVENGYMDHRTTFGQGLDLLWLKVQRKFRRRFGKRRAFKDNQEQMTQIAAKMLEKLEKGIRWGNTRAHAEPPGYVWICTKDRYPLGTVEPGDEYRRVREEIRNGFAELTDPDTGEPVFDRVLTKDEAFDGPAADNAPDIVLMCRPGFITEYGLRKNFTVGPSQGARFNGYHVMTGLFVASGPCLKQGVTIDGARILDIAPTILHLLDLPVPPAMKGVVLTDACEPEALAKRPVRIEDVAVQFKPSSHGEVERESIEQSLRDLGYM